MPHSINYTRAALAFVISMATASAFAQSAAPTGEIKGEAWVHTKDSLAASSQQADVCLPAVATGGAVFCGKFKDIPKFSGAHVTVVVFMHGSSGLKAIGEWQQWLAGLGYASIAPDSFALAGHVTYKSPIDKESYEKIHALRASEIAPTLAALKDNTAASILLVPNAPHTLLNLPATRSATAGFLSQLAKP